MPDQIEPESLGQEAAHIIEEARMVLPGIQALFGFQTIAVFNQRFSDLPDAVARLHLASLMLVVVAIMLVMATASYHRIAEPGQATRSKIRRTSKLIWTAMFFLMFGLGLDIFVVVFTVTGDATWSAVLGGCVTTLCASLWFVFPLWMRAHLGS